MRRATWPLIATLALGCGASSEADLRTPPPPSPAASASAIAEAAPAETTAVDTAPPGGEEAEPVADGPRIGSIRFRTWIWPEPFRKKDRLAVGALRVGTTVRLKSTEPVQGFGCNSKWLAIEPFGYVCEDETTTRDFSTPYWKALAAQGPRKGPWPYRYAFSTGAPMYSRIPTKAEQTAAERDYGPLRTFKPLGKWSEGHEKLVSTREEDAFATDGAVPEFFRGVAPIEGSPWHPANPKVKTMPAGSGFGYSRVFDAEGRRWLLTSDLFLIPADRVFPYTPSEFRGVELDAERNLPLAWVRAKTAVARFEKKDGAFVASSATFPPRAPVFLTGKREKVAGVTYFEAKDGGHVRDDDDVTVIEQAKALKHNIGPDDRWIETSILGGTLVAYEGLVARYTTLWSPGKGGVPKKGNDPKKFATTEVGVFPIQWKDAVETMSPDPGAPTVFWFQDVPFIQYVHAPMAMHVSFWHDEFGYPMSAECLNVSARDGEWLFGFTGPKLPPGWGSVGSSKLTGKGTRVNIVP